MVWSSKRQLRERKKTQKPKNLLVYFPPLPEDCYISLKNKREKVHKLNHTMYQAKHFHEEQQGRRHQAIPVSGFSQPHPRQQNWKQHSCTALHQRLSPLTSGTVWATDRLRERSDTCREQCQPQPLTKSQHWLKGTALAVLVYITFFVVVAQARGTFLHLCDPGKLRWAHSSWASLYTITINWNFSLFFSETDALTVFN